MILLAKDALAQAPSITGLSPTSGVPGTQVTVTGTSFGTAGGTVTFNGTAATTIRSWGNTSILTAVPYGATTGVVVVTPIGGTQSNGVIFTVPAPSITSLSPTLGAPGTQVAIYGINFGTVGGTLTFNGTSATTIISWGNTSILTAVPTRATTGNVVVTAGGTPSNGAIFTVPAPLITSLSPTSGKPGTSVTITGTNFGTAGAG